MSRPDTPVSQPGTPTDNELRERIAAVQLRDVARLRRLAGAGEAEGARLVAQLEAAEAALAARREAVPPLRYPVELPIVARREEIVQAIADNQVLVVAGETGSGKSTQLPKLCLEAGRGLRGLIGHTQPRRIAARSVAERLAEELGSTVGDAVGYTVRFTDTVRDSTYVKVMTDGILLAEIGRDRNLWRYDTIIVDEAHERSLNIDFILGYLHQLLPRRPDLKLIITSATIDTDRFAAHFGGPGGPAPVVTVSGRSYPVEVRYRPQSLDDGGESDRDQVQAICDAVDELSGEGRGDVLVFLSGEREIRDTADALRAQAHPNTEILPLYARLSAAEQHRVFASHRGRRVVLATNVAETSLTVPGIRYVVDPGTARISRFNRRTKVQRLPIEAVSKASANQRAGRCGRVAPGICIRLYSEDDFDARPDYTEPEILRTNLASVILQMATLGFVGPDADIAAFPFVEPPDTRAVNDGIALLTELGALDPSRAGTKGWLTPLGRRLARLPVDPRMGRMVIEADRLGCLREVLVLAALLSIQDPRERPSDKQQAADQAHARFVEREAASDFVTLLHLWDEVRVQQRELSSNQFRRWCRTNFLNYLRVREWQDLYRQLHQVARELGLRDNHEAAHPDNLHRALLSGLLSHLAVLQDDTRSPARTERGRGATAPSRPRGAAPYLGARGARLSIAPGSSLARSAPRWVMAAELVETNRLWARVVARVKPEWAEQLAGHLVRRSYSDPQWDPARGSAVVAESVTLYGLTLVSGRRVDYSRIDPAAARDLFILHGLAEGNWRGRHAFVAHNDALLAEIDELTHRARRRDLGPSLAQLVEFFDERVPAHVTGAAGFDRWWKGARSEAPDRFDLRRDDLLGPGAALPSLADFPDVWRQGKLSFPLRYRFDPTEADDGVTVTIGVEQLNQVDRDSFGWHIPGLRAELVAELMRTLPKEIRRHLLPVSDHAAAFLASNGPGDGPLRDRLYAYVRRAAGVPVPAGSLDFSRLAPYLSVTFEVVGANGRTLAAGKDLDAVRARLGVRMRDVLAEAAPALEAAGLRSWPEAGLVRRVELVANGQTVRGYPALVDEGETVAVRVLPSIAEQEEAHWAGLRRLLQLSLPSATKSLLGRLTKDARASLSAVGYPGPEAFVADCVTASLDHLLMECGGPVWDAAAFEALLGAVKARFAPHALAVLADASKVATAARAVQRRLDQLVAPAATASVADIRQQLANLLYPGFLTATGVEHVAHLPRYLAAIDRRLDKLPADPQRDLANLAPVRALEADFGDLLDAAGPAAPPVPVAEVHWMLEELRVSVFAQQLGTAYPVSEKRVRTALASLHAACGL